jgi:hypothetical protein
VSAIGAEPDVQDTEARERQREHRQSAFDRWRADPSNRHRNLVEWADRKHADPTQIAASVRDDDPRIAGWTFGGNGGPDGILKCSMSFGTTIEGKDSFKGRPSC